MVHFRSQIPLIRNFGATFSWRPLLMAPPSHGAPATPGQRYATEYNLLNTINLIVFNQ